MEHFFHIIIHYAKEVIPALFVGFLISGFVHEFVPENTVMKYLGKKGIMPILSSTIIGAILPVCCWGALPIAISFYKKGAKLGPILAFLVATPATSISALAVTYSVLGLSFAAYIFISVIIMGLGIGIIGNSLKVKPRTIDNKKEFCPHCAVEPHEKHVKKESTAKRAKDILLYAFIDMPKEIGVELVFGLLLAAFVATFVPIGNFIHTYLIGWAGYAFSVVFGIITYFCSTASVPLVDSLINQGLSKGAGMTLLIIGPITSYGTILVLRKEFGSFVLTVFLAFLTIISVLLGIGYNFFV